MSFSQNTAPQPLPGALVYDILHDIFTMAAGTCSPFAISGVCQTWDEVAQAIPQLWTYPLRLTIPAHDVGTPGCLELVDSMLDRCRNSPLHINIRWSRHVDQSNARACVKLLQRLAAESHRWRTVRLELPAHARPHWLYFLSCQAPMLEQLVVRMHPGFENATRTAYGRRLAYLPDAQRLEVLSVDYAPELLAPRAGLTELNITGAIPARRLWRMLRACGATLQRLFVDLPYTPAATDAPHAPVPLTALESLHCAGFTHHLFSSPMVHLPNVTELALLRYEEGKVWLGPHLADRLRVQASTLTFSLPGRTTLATCDGWTITRALRLRRLVLLWAELSREFLIACMTHGDLPFLERLDIYGTHTIGKETGIIELLWYLLRARGATELVLVLECCALSYCVAADCEYGVEDIIAAHSAHGVDCDWSIHVAFDPTFEPKQDGGLLCR